MDRRPGPHPITGESISVIEPDHVLASRATTDRHAFAELYLRYLDPLYGYCYRRLGTREAAEDATSLVFTHALEALPTLRTTHVRSWLFTIAHHVVVDTYRRQPRTIDFDHAEPWLPAVEEDQATLRGLEADSLYRALDALTNDQRQVVELRLAGLTGPEIREVLGRSRSWVDTTQHRAVQRLRAVLAPSPEVPDA
jgi:RNA polymerase sigma-70 factor (ECF subfamily)